MLEIKRYVNTKVISVQWQSVIPNNKLFQPASPYTIPRPERPGFPTDRLGQQAVSLRA